MASETSREAIYLGADQDRRGTVEWRHFIDKVVAELDPSGSYKSTKLRRPLVQNVLKHFHERTFYVPRGSQYVPQAAGVSDDSAYYREASPEEIRKKTDKRLDSQIRKTRGNSSSPRFASTKKTVAGVNQSIAIKPLPTGKAAAPKSIPKTIEFIPSLPALHGSQHNGDLHLHSQCIWNRSVESIRRLLLRYPHEISMVDKFGSLPFHNACRWNASMEVIELIYSEYPDAIKAVDEKGRLPLAVACAWDRPLDVIGFLYAKYEEAIRITDSHGQFPLHIACGRNTSPGVVKFLLSKYGEAASMLDWHDQTPLDIACLSNRSKGDIEILLNKNPNAISRVDSQGQVPMHLACAYCTSREVVEYLASSYPDSVMIKDRLGRLPHRIALDERNKLDIVILLESMCKKAPTKPDDGSIPSRRMSHSQKKRRTDMNTFMKIFSPAASLVGSSHHRLLRNASNTADDGTVCSKVSSASFASLPTLRDFEGNLVVIDNVPCLTRRTHSFAVESFMSSRSSGTLTRSHSLYNSSVSRCQRRMEDGTDASKRSGSSTLSPTMVEALQLLLDKNLSFRSVPTSRGADSLQKKEGDEPEMRSLGSHELEGLASARLGDLLSIGSASVKTLEETSI